ncbi:MAG TPA: phage tail sheath subtilisin-like domain-containing protein [Chloroflexota bacterium]|jgi:hypothetical protein|nr:phage tail sheath subtilisin-like domain-containing protein [Chloroflexota bacterium]
MPEVITEMILPDTYIEVRPEALISVPPIATGRIAVCGTAARGPAGVAVSLGSFSQAKEVFGNYDAWVDGASDELTLVRALELMFNNGATDVLAVRVAAGPVVPSQAVLNDAATPPVAQTRLLARDPGSWADGATADVRRESLRRVQVAAVLIGEGNGFNTGHTQLQLADADLVRRGLATGGLGPGDVTVENRTTGEAYTFRAAAADRTTRTDFTVDQASGRLTFGAAQTAEHTLRVTYFRTSTRVTLTLPTGEQEVYADVASGQALSDAVDANAGSLFRAEPATTTPSTNPLATGTFSFGAGANGAAAGSVDYGDALALFEREAANIVVLAGQTLSDAADVLAGHLDGMENQGKERLGIIGAGLGADRAALLNDANTVANDRIVFVAPGVRAVDAAASQAQRRRVLVTLPGAYTAAAVAGLIAGLAPHVSPTSKTVNVAGLEAQFLRNELKDLVQNRVLALEVKTGIRVVRGITTDPGPFAQITTRRIVDFAKEGIRRGSLPFIGRLNNERVRKALRGTLDGFLVSMVLAEMLTGYTLDVTAARADEIAGRALVTVFLRPTFSIDFIRVTMYLE